MPKKFQPSLPLGYGLAQSTGAHIPTEFGSGSDGAVDRLVYVGLSRLAFAPQSGCSGASAIFIFGGNELGVLQLSRKRRKMVILLTFPVFARLSAQKKTLQMLLHKVSFSIRVLLSGVALKHNYFGASPILIFGGNEIGVLQLS